MNEAITWGIVGAGWLGTELVSRLEQAGLKCWSTHRKTFDWELNAFPLAFCDVLFLKLPHSPIAVM